MKGQKWQQGQNIIQNQKELEQQLQLEVLLHMKDPLKQESLLHIQGLQHHLQGVILHQQGVVLHIVLLLRQGVQAQFQEAPHPGDLLQVRADPLQDEDNEHIKGSQLIGSLFYFNNFLDYRSLFLVYQLCFLFPAFVFQSS